MPALAAAVSALATGQQDATLKASAAAAPIYEQAKLMRKTVAWSDLRKGVIMFAVGVAYAAHGDRHPKPDHGGAEDDAFHVIAPSLPGYGWSGPTPEPGWHTIRVAAAFVEARTQSLIPLPNRSLINHATVINQPYGSRNPRRPNRFS